MLKEFYQNTDGTLSFSREMASRFAKDVANDYNPLHDADAKRFCVPGDLLFSVILLEYGISQNMQISFDSMITETSSITLPEPSQTLELSDDKKNYVTVERKGNNASNPSCVESIINQYVNFSGEAFPHILVPTMSAKGLMINPKRPMVMYQNMSLEFDTVDLNAPTLEPLSPIFNAEGKRGTVTLPFNWKDGDTLVGRGEKVMLVSGMVEYDKVAMDSLIDRYNQSKENHAAD